MSFIEGSPDFAKLSPEERNSFLAQFYHIDNLLPTATGELPKGSIDLHLGPRANTIFDAFLLEIQYMRRASSPEYVTLRASLTALLDTAELLQPPFKDWIIFDHKFRYMKGRPVRPLVMLPPWIHHDFPRGVFDTDIPTITTIETTSFQDAALYNSLDPTTEVGRRLKLLKGGIGGLEFVEGQVVQTETPEQEAIRLLQAWGQDLRQRNLFPN